MNNIPQITIGVDLGDTKHHYCVLDQAGNVLREDSLPNTREALEKFAGEYPGARVAIEVGTHSPWVSQLLAISGLEVHVANARKLRAVYDNERKCDVLDARMLARIARLDPELLSPVHHISQEALADRMVLGNRDRLVEARKALVQSARSSFKSLGHRIPPCSPGPFPARVREALKVYLSKCPSLYSTCVPIFYLKMSVPIFRPGGPREQNLPRLHFPCPPPAGNRACLSGNRLPVGAAPEIPPQCKFRLA